MSNVRTLARSFAGGEITPEMFGRLDLAAFQTGLATCRNFTTLPHGPAANRPGFEFVRAVKDSTKRTRLIPFAFSTTQTFIIELGHQYARFHTMGATLLNGAVPYEVVTPYQEADLFDIHYVQSADVLTLVHPNYAPRELRRLGATNWTLTPISFASTISPPAGLAATAIAGTGTASNINHFYVVTALLADTLEESPASAEVSVSNDLKLPGSYNSLTWTAVAGATRYNIYKKDNGLYGYIGQTSSAGFEDHYITPDLSNTPPEVKNPFNAAGSYPAAVSYFEQRRVFGGTTIRPQNMWLTRSGTESNLSSSIPTRDDDSIAFRIAAREANTIRHIVPLSDMILLTASAEWRVTSADSGAIRPSSVSVRPQTYIGANNVQPAVVNNSLLYAAAKGGRVRELVYTQTVSGYGYTNSDISMLAPHLFDFKTIVDIAFARTPYPIMWAVSSDGRLLGLTYVPEQKVAGWHQHDTDGTFESVAAVTEGDEDALYAIVKRTINGNSVRYVERLHSRQFAILDDAFFVDAGLTLDNPVPSTLTPGAGATVKGTTGVTFTAMGFVTGDIGREIHYRYTTTDGDGKISYFTAKATITTYLAPNAVQGTIDVPFPSLATIPAGGWHKAFMTISGLDHLEGMKVSILADGAVAPQQVVTGGIVTLEHPASKVHVGLPITADLKTLPITTEQIPAFGQGRPKNVNKVFMRVYRSSSIKAGPSGTKLREVKQRTNEPYGTPPSLIESDEIEVMLDSNWNQNGHVMVRQSDPLPLTVVSLSLEVAVGG